MENKTLLTKPEKLGHIGGKVSGFKRKQKTLFLINFVKMIEMLEFPDLRITSSLAKKLIIGFTGNHSIKNSYLNENFAIKDNTVRQENLNDIVADYVERHKELYDEQWESAKEEIEREAIQLKKDLIAAVSTH